jgi:hypothetical protein
VTSATTIRSLRLKIDTSAATYCVVSQTSQYSNARIRFRVDTQSSSEFTNVSWETHRVKYDYLANSNVFDPYMYESTPTASATIGTLPV